MEGCADLPDELLHVILSKLFDRDRYNFKLVCRSWNGVAVSSSYHNTPCLIYYDRRKKLWGFFQYKSFFYRRFPEFENAEILCCRYGWLLMARDNNSLFLWDPFNEIKVDLDTRVIYGCCDTVNLFGPPTSSDSFILGISGYSGSINIDVLKYGSKEWLYKKHECGSKFMVSLATPVLHHGLIYFLDMKGDIGTIDIKSDSLKIKTYTKCLKFHRIRNKIRRHYLLKINDDALYAVFITMHDSEVVDLFRLEETNMKWKRVKDLGDITLYLSQASCYGDVANTKRMENTICFTTFDGDDHPLFYSFNTRKYHPFEGDDSFGDFSNVVRLDRGVAWIVPMAEPTQLSVWGRKV